MALYLEWLPNCRIRRKNWTVLYLYAYRQHRILSICICWSTSRGGPQKWFNGWNASLRCSAWRRLRRLGGDLIVAFQSLKGTDSLAGLVVTEQEELVSGLEWWFSLNIRKSYLVRVMRHRSRLPREVDALSLEMFEVSLKWVLSNLT